MQIERSFKISCPHFGGFVADLSVNDFDSLDEIVSAVLDQLKATLAAGGFEALLSILDADAAKYHIHDMTVEGIIMGEGTSPYYVCNHGCVQIPTHDLSSSVLSVGVEPSAPADEESDGEMSETTSLL